MDPFLDFSYLKVLKGNMVKDGEMTEKLEELLHFQTGTEKLDKIEEIFSKKMGTPLEIILS